MIAELLGWCSSICFAICAFPQAWVCYKQGHGRGISRKFMWIWLGGELFAFPYTLISFGWQWPIMFNLTLNTIFLIVILYYIYFPRDKDAQL